MILVAGGTGMLGRSLIPLLAGHGEPIRILTRGGRPSPQLTLPGTETVIGDVRDPETLRRAMAGVRTVISAINGFGGDGALGVEAIDRDGNVNLVGAAEAAGVEHFVLVSIQQAAADHPIELFRMKAAAEERLRDSRLSWTIVRPTAYQETWLEIVGRPLVTTRSTRVFGRGQNPINFVSAGDVARIVDVAVTDPEPHLRRVRGRREIDDRRDRDREPRSAPDASPDVPHPSPDQARPGRPDGGVGRDGHA